MFLLSPTHTQGWHSLEKWIVKNGAVIQVSEWGQYLVMMMIQRTTQLGIHVMKPHHHHASQPPLSSSLHYNKLRVHPSVDGGRATVKHPLIWFNDWAPSIAQRVQYCMRSARSGRERARRRPLIELYTHWMVKEFAMEGMPSSNPSMAFFYTPAAAIQLDWMMTHHRHHSLSNPWQAELFFSAVAPVQRKQPSRSQFYQKISWWST